MVARGYRSQLGVAEETTYGTLVVPSRFYEFVSESIAVARGRIESAGLRNREFQSRFKPGAISPEGSVSMELATKGFGLWFKHALGAVATSQPAVATDPTVFDHLFTAGDLTAKSLSVQVGRDVNPFTYTGCKVGNVEIGCQVEGLATVAVGLVARGEDLAAGLATATYPASDLVSFVEGVLTLGGVEIPVTQCTWTLENTLATDRWQLGSALRRNPERSGFRNLTGSFEADFDLALYNRYVSGETAELKLKFAGATITGTYKYETEVKAQVRFDGDTPTVGGPEEIRETVNFKGMPVTGDADALSIRYRTTDTLP